MSPYEQNFRASPSSLRTKYAYLFDTIIQLYRFSFASPDEKVSKRADDIWPIIEKMHESKALNDYLYSSLEEVFRLYPSLLPGVVSKAFEEDEEKERAHLDRLDKLLSIVQGDLSSELSDLIDQQYEHDREWIDKTYNRY